MRACYPRAPRTGFSPGHSNAVRLCHRQLRPASALKPHLPAVTQRHARQQHTGVAVLAAAPAAAASAAEASSSSKQHQESFAHRPLAIERTSSCTSSSDARDTTSHAGPSRSDAQEHSAASACSSTTSGALDHSVEPVATTRSNSGAAASSSRAFAYAPAERDQIRGSWDTLMRWSKVIRKTNSVSLSSLEETSKVAVFGGGSFGTAMAASLARQKADMDVIVLLRDPKLCNDINTMHCNTRYLSDFKLPTNVRATTNAAEAISGAQFAVHAVPVQGSRAFLKSIKEILPPSVPLISVSKGLELGTGLMMSELIPNALERKQPAVYISGPSFAKEVMEHRPTGVVAACKDIKLATTVQELFASPTMRVNTTTDVVGVEICGALKNVLAIAAGIVEGLDLGNNAMAALVAQGCSEIRWLAEKMGAKPATLSGLSGLGDIMLTCYGSLSRNRSVGVRLGKGDKLEDIIGSTSQVAEGVATAGVVVLLARKYRVSLPVLTAVAQVLDNNITAKEAVNAIMNLPQMEEV